MKLALIVGIDHYERAPLSGCVNDAIAIEEALSRNRDGSPDFSTKLVVSSQALVSRSFLKGTLSQLFSAPCDVALFYFSGHGLLNDLGGFLVTQDAEHFDEGVSMADVLAMANQSNSREVVVILDCCHSGAFGSIPAVTKDVSLLREGVSVLCATRDSELALENSGRGVFSALVCEALYGGAAGLLGEVTAADVFAFVHRTIAPWGQRPLFKCHVSKLATLRMCDPQIAVTILRRLPQFFSELDSVYKLDPSYEPEAATSFSAEQEEALNAIRSYRAVGLVAPVDAADMIQTALLSGGCRLTKLGQYYWQIVKSKMI